MHRRIGIGKWVAIRFPRTTQIGKTKTGISIPQRWRICTFKCHGTWDTFFRASEYRITAFGPLLCQDFKYTQKLTLVIPTNPNALRDRKFVRQQASISGVGQTWLLGIWSISSKQIHYTFGQKLSPDRTGWDIEDRESNERQKYRGRKNKSKNNQGKIFGDYHPPPLNCNPVDRLSRPLAYFIHERCWRLTRQVIGANNLENNLDLFPVTVHQTNDEILKTYCGCGKSVGYLSNEVFEELPVPEELRVDGFMKDPGNACESGWIRMGILIDIQISCFMINGHYWAPYPDQ